MKYLLASRKGVRSEGGFTLVEVLIVLVIIIALAALYLKIAPGAIAKKNVAAITKMAGDISAALTRYKGDTGSYPQYLQALWDKTAVPAGTQAYWQGPYMAQPDMTSGSSPDEDIQDANNVGVVYSYAAVSTSNPGTGSCTLGAIVPNNTNGIAYTIKVAAVPQDVAWALAKSQGNGVCVSDSTNPTPDVYFLVDSAWGN